MEPFIHPGVPAYIMNVAEKSANRQIDQLRGWSTRLHVSLDLHAPTLLLPQKSASPNLIIMNMGEFTITQLHRMSWAVIISFVIPVVLIIKLDWGVCTSLKQLYGGRDMYKIYYVKNNYMFRPFTLAVIRLRNEKKLSKQLYLSYVGCVQWRGKR